MAKERDLPREAPPKTAAQAAMVSPPAPVDDDEIIAATRITEPSPTQPIRPAKAPASSSPSSKPNGLRPVPESSAARERDLPHEAPPKAATAAPASAATARPTYASTVRPTSPVATPTSASAETPAPSGTLYYSTTPRKEKETPAPAMKTTSTTAAPAASSSSATSIGRPAAAATASRAAGPVDYRSNIERQAREQKSIGSVLTWIVYGFIGVFLVVAGLAGYGLYTLSKQISAQSVTMTELDRHYAEQTGLLKGQLKTTSDDLAAAQSQIGKQQQVIQQQQATLAKLVAATDDLSSSLQQERQARAVDSANFRARLRLIESEGQASSGRTTQVLH